jgi:hypothetical protein
MVVLDGVHFQVVTERRLVDHDVSIARQVAESTLAQKCILLAWTSVARVGDLVIILPLHRYAVSLRAMHHRYALKLHTHRAKNMLFHGLSIACDLLYKPSYIGFCYLRHRSISNALTSEGLLQELIGFDRLGESLNRCNLGLSEGLQVMLVVMQPRNHQRRHHDE